MGRGRQLDRALRELRARTRERCCAICAAAGAGSATRRWARSASLALFAAVAVQVGLGLVSQDEDGLYAGPLAGLVSIDTSDKARDIHELWFNVVLGLDRPPRRRDHLLPLVAGRHLTKPMITGRAVLDPGAQPMRPGKWWVALICLAVAIGITRWIVAGAPPFGH